MTKEITRKKRTSMLHQLINKKKINLSFFSGNMLLRVTLCCLLFAAACTTSTKKLKYPEPLTPEQALKSFDLHKDFSIEVFAAEPYVLDPVDLAFDAAGNIYVVEMPDYPFQPEPGKEAGNIRVLIDSNHDGRIDKSIVFADKLSEATSILPYKDGLIVTAAPDILFLKDTTGDFKADIRKVLFTGFFKANPEAQITSLRYGVDNWIYANNRGQAGQVTSATDADAPALSMQGADFRFRLDEDKFELETGPGQFGQTINDWGHRFFTENTIHLQQAIIPWRYLHRPSAFQGGRAVLNISDHDPIMFQQTKAPYWRAARTAARNRNYKEQGLDRVEYEDDHFTGASGGTVYTGDAFPKEFYDNIFTGEVAGNLVHRDVLLMTDSSPVYIAKRDAVEQDREFLASTDEWFRPVGFTVGPDGYLYVIDYYRQHIETPVSIPDSLKADMDFMRGSDMGRIFRVLPKTASSTERKPFADLTKLSSLELVALLAHPNQWTRLQAQRLLIERQDKSVAEAVKKLLTHTDARARLHAIYTLEGLQLLDATIVTNAIKDAHPGVREHGMILAERYPQCLPLLLEGIKDKSARVALQATLSVGGFPKQSTMIALAECAEIHGNDPWFKAAIMGSAAASSTEFLKLLISRGQFFSNYTKEKAVFVTDMFYAVASQKNAAARISLATMLSSGEVKGNDWQLAGLKGLAKAVRTDKTYKTDEKMKSLLQNLEVTANAEVKDSIQSLINYSVK